MIELPVYFRDWSHLLKACDQLVAVMKLWESLVVTWKLRGQDPEKLLQALALASIK